MKDASVKTQDYRNRTKQRMIAAMGGACVCCGYDRVSRALQFHHLDPKEKELVMTVAKHMTWARRVVELRKCVLVCGNCHAEIHAGLRDVPLAAKRFDESFAVVLCESLYDVCGCGKEKRRVLKFCSHSCATRARYEFDWRRILTRYEELQNYEQVGREFGCSGKAVSKHVRKFGVIA